MHIQGFQAPVGTTQKAIAPSCSNGMFTSPNNFLCSSRFSLNKGWSQHNGTVMSLLCNKPNHCLNLTALKKLPTHMHQQTLFTIDWTCLMGILELTVSDNASWIHHFWENSRTLLYPLEGTHRLRFTLNYIEWAKDTDRLAFMKSKNKILNIESYRTMLYRMSHNTTWRMENRNFTSTSKQHQSCKTSIKIHIINIFYQQSTTWYQNHLGHIV